MGVKESQFNSSSQVSLSTSALHRQQAHKHLPHFKEEKPADNNEDHTQGDEVYRMVHPIW